MAETQQMRLVKYWRMAWKKRPPSRFFTPYRAIPSTLIAAVAFLVKHHKNRSASPLDTWIAIGIIVGVYLVLYAIESLWRFVMVSPVNLEAEAVAVSERLVAANSEVESENLRLKAALSEPKISPHEERLRQRAKELLIGFTPEEKKVLQRILDDGGVPKDIMFETLAVKHEVILRAIDKALKNGLMEIAPGQGPTQITPSLRPALAYVLDQDSSRLA